MSGIKRKWTADALSPNTSPHEEKEIYSVRGIENGDTPRKNSHVKVHTGKQLNLKVMVHIPVDEYPNFNFIGKLLGPKGSSLQQLQDVSQTKMAIRGRGSIKDKKREEELREQGDPKYSHLHEDLHVEISAYAAPAEAYRRMSLAIGEIQRFLDYVAEMHHPQYNGKPKPSFAGEGPLAPMSGLPLPPRRRHMGPISGGRKFPRPPAMAQRYAREDEERPASRPSSRLCGLHGNATAPVPRAARMKPIHQ